MANAFYTAFKANQLTNTAVDFTEAGSVEFSWTLIDLADYTFSAAHDFLDDVAAGARVAEGAILTSKTTTGGVFDAADNASMFTAVTGDQSEALILKVDTGTAATERLILFLDTGITGIPVTPNGGNIGVTHNASGIFAL